MAQHDYNLANQNGAAFRADLNSALEAVQSQNSGATEPASTVAYMPWADTNAGMWKVRNAADSAWVSVLSLTASRVDTAAGTYYDNSGSGLAATNAKDALDELDAAVTNISGDYYSTTNILGTVSQTAGVPTGAIIERGSNANGEFVKYADGTLICWHLITGTYPISTPLGGGFFADVGWNLPAPFASAEYRVFATPHESSSFGAIGRAGTDSSATLSFTSVESSPSALRGIQGLAVGRWF